MRKTMAVVLVLLASMSACMNQANEEPEDKKPTEILPSHTPEITATQEQSPTFTSTPEEEDPPTPVQTEVRILSDGVGMESPGPWIIFKTDEGFVLVSQDGSRIGMIPLSQEYFVQYWEATLQGGMVAFIKENYIDKILEVKSIKNNDALLDLNLMTYEGEPLSFDNENIATQFELDRYLSVGQIEWSNDGNTLAFVGSHLGPSPDVYSFEIATDTVTRLTTDPSHVAWLNWTPDDQYIFHAGVTEMFADTSGAGDAGWVFWSAKPDGSKIFKVIDGLIERGEERVIGWHANNQALMVSGYWWCGYFDFRRVNIETGKRVTIWKDQFDNIAYDPVSKTALVWVSPDAVSIDDCGPTTESGLYLVSVPWGQREKVTDFENDYIVNNIKWSEEASRFVIDFYTIWALVSSEGEATVFEEEPIFSPDGKMTALLGYKGESLQILDQDDNLIEIDTDSNVQHPTWSLDGSRLFFLLKNDAKGYDLYMALTPDF